MRVFLCCACAIFLLFCSALRHADIVLLCSVCSFVIVLCLICCRFSVLFVQCSAMYAVFRTDFVFTRVLYGLLCRVVWCCAAAAVLPAEFVPGWLAGWTPTFCSCVVLLFVLLFAAAMSRAVLCCATLCCAVLCCFLFLWSRDCSALLYCVPIVLPISFVLAGWRAQRCCSAFFFFVLFVALPLCAVLFFADTCSAHVLGFAA